MAVYERTYRAYEGARTVEWSRFLVIPRYAYQQIFASKSFLVFLVVCFFYPLLTAFAIYIPHNLGFLKLLQLDPKTLIEGVQQFMFPVRFMRIQGFLSFLLVFFIGPSLVSVDLANNGLPLYLSRPFSRAEYVLGKLSVLAILLSAITWIPGLLLFALQSYLMGWQWFLDNLRIPFGIFVASWAWILVLSLLVLALSAYVRWRLLSRVALFAVMVVLPPFAVMANALLNVSWGRMLILGDMMTIVGHALFGTEPLFPFPVGAAAISLAVACGLSLFLLARKLQAYEVVR